MASLTSYKVSSITRYDDGRVEVLARIYEGDITTENERHGADEALVPITRYRASRMLRELRLTSPNLPPGAADAQIRRILNEELRTDTTRIPIPEQRN